MSIASTQDIISLADLYAGHRGLSHWRVSFLVRGNGKFLRNLMDGAGCTVATHKKCLEWFSENWPEDLDWPDDVPRPALSDQRRAG